MCGMKGKSVVGLLIPMRTGCASAVCKQAVDEQKKKKKKKNRITPTLRKGICIFSFLFFWTLIKAESRGVFSFVWCSFCPVIHSSWKTKPLHDPPWSRTPPESGGGHAKNWKLFFFVLLFSLLVDSERHPGRFSQTLRSHLPGSTSGQERRLKRRFLVIYDDLLRGGAEQTQSHRPGQICLFRIHWLHWLFFNVICGGFFYSKKKKKKRTQRKKIIKRLEKIQYKNNSVSLYTLYTEQAHILRQHTHNNTAVSLLTAPLEIRLIRFRKIIIKLINRAGKQNTAWQALCKHTHTHTHTHTHQLMRTHTRTLFLELYVLLPDLFSQ